MLTQERLREVISYCPESGVFRWRVRTSNRVHVGDEVAAVAAGNGYRYTSIDGKRYTQHRIAWLYVYGVFPDLQIDHVDGNRANNAISNLRLATQSENTCNGKLRTSNRSGLKGVHWSSSKKKWKAEITKNYRNVFLGYFDSKEDGHAAYLAASEHFHGEFANSGKDNHVCL